MPKALAEILRNATVIERLGPGDPAIEGLAYDSRSVRPGYLFFALPGLHADGHRFIDAAIAAGARAVVHSSPIPDPRPGVAYVRVPDPRLEAQAVAARQ